MILYDFAAMLVADEVEQAKKTGYMLGSDGKMHLTVAEALRRLVEGHVSTEQ